MERNNRPVLIMLVAIGVLFFLSFLGWEELSGGMFKSFDLFSDIRPEGSRAEAVHGGNEYLDPDLAMLDNEGRDYDRYEYIDDDEADNGADDDTATTDVEEDAEQSTEAELEAQPLDIGMPAENPSPIVQEGEKTPKPLTAKSTTGEKTESKPKKTTAPKESAPVQASRRSSTVPAPAEAGKIFEDYSQGQTNTAKLRTMLGKAPSKLQRIAVLGDSYIEGDIFTSDIRELLQTAYGGKGIGYTPMYSEIPGFRRSVVHSCNGFEVLDFRNRGSRPYCLLPGVACKAQDEAAVTFSGTSKIRNVGSWDRTTLLFKTPAGGSLRVKNGKGKEAQWQTFTFSPSDRLQALEVEGPTSSISIGAITPGIVFQGALLDGNTGIAVDNMSIRGYAGIRHDEVDARITDEARPYIDYDLVVLEFGINALTSTQTNYDSYARKMEKVVEHVKELYPRAVVMIMGIGDRGEKTQGEIHSMSTAANMVDAQRAVARNTGSLFWDTRAAMGGDDAVVDWVANKEINKDYIHLSFTGGKRLGRLFVDALDRTLNKK